MLNQNARIYTVFWSEYFLLSLFVFTWKKKANSQNIMNKKTVLKPQQQQQSLGAERKKNARH